MPLGKPAAAEILKIAGDEAKPYALPKAAHNETADYPVAAALARQNSGMSESEMRYSPSTSRGRPRTVNYAVAH